MFGTNFRRGLIAASVLAGLGGVSVTPTASATLVGDSVDLAASHTFTGSCNATYIAIGVTVGAGIELGIGDHFSGSCSGGVEIDVYDASFDLIGFHEPAGFADLTESVIMLSDLDLGTSGPIIGVTFDSALTDLFHAAGEGFADELPNMVISFTDDSITIFFGSSPGLNWEYRDGGVGSFSILTASVPVPAPTTVLLLGAGLLGLGAGARRSRS